MFEIGLSHGYKHHFENEIFTKGLHFEWICNIHRTEIQYHMSDTLSYDLFLFALPYLKP